MKRSLFALIFTLLVAILPAVPVQTYAQCPMCKANVESTIRSDATKKSGMGLNAGIILLLGMPYVAVMVVGVLWYRNSRYQKAKRLNLEA